MSDNQTAEGSTSIELDQPAGEGGTYMEIDQPPATGEIDETDKAAVREPDEVEERTDQPIDEQVDPDVDADLQSPTYDDGSGSPGPVLQY